MSSEEAAGAERVTFDFVGLIEWLTGLTGWVEEKGPDSGVGLDYWYVLGEGPERAYVHVDQTVVEVNVYIAMEDESEGVGIVFIEGHVDQPPVSRFVTREVLDADTAALEG